MSDGDELKVYKTNPLNEDTDSDGLRDGNEVNINHTNPVTPDSDGDGMPDGWEVRYGLDPLNDDAYLDLDHDGYYNLLEYQRDSAPNDPASIPRQTRVFVDDDAPNDPGPRNPNWSDPLENGSAEHPYDSIQKGINAAGKDQTVVVLDGTYTGTGNRNISFNGKAITVQSENGPAHCVIDGQQNSRGFIFNSGETAASVLDGFTITRGQASEGAGIYVKGASPSIHNCILTVNGSSTTSRGGGIYLEKSSSEIVGCTITSNRVTYPDTGGGLFAIDSDLRVLYCTFADNIGQGARIYRSDNGQAAMTVLGCDILRNQGRGVESFRGRLTLADCRIEGNVSDGPGGGVIISGAPGRIDRCRFVGNRSRQGGGFMVSNASIIDIYNSIFTDNYASESGGGASFGNGAIVRVVNCTFVRNYSPLGSGILEDSYHNSLDLVNTLVWGNAPGTDMSPKDQIALPYGTYYPSSFSAEGCDIQGGRDGVVAIGNKWTILWKQGNIDADPNFADPASGDYHLTADSPCVDTGILVPELDGLTDLDSGPRIVNSCVDIGADEYDFLRSALEVSESGVVLESHPQSPLAGPYLIWVHNNGNRLLNWSIRPVAPSGWLSIEPDAGILQAGQSRQVFLRANGSALPAGTYSAELVVSATGASNPPRQVRVEFRSFGWEDPATGYGGGSGAAADPYRLWTAEQFCRITQSPADWDKSFILMADLDLAAFDGLQDRPALAPIGGQDPESGFGGNFDGQGHRISNATLRNAAGDFAGVFTWIRESGEIRNLHLTEVSVQGRQRVGGLTGINEGFLDGCSSSGMVQGLTSVGGLVGQNQGTIRGCSASIAVMAAGYYVGGLVGDNGWGSITQCSATGTVKADAMAGGLVGKNQAIIADCYSFGSVSGRMKIGGLVGWNRNGTIDRCFAAGKVAATADIAGGLVGINNEEGAVLRSFWDLQAGGVPRSDGGIGATTLQMQTADTYILSGWDFAGETYSGTEDIWRMCTENTSYPRLSRPFASAGDYDCPDGVGLEDAMYLALRWLSASPEGCGSADGNADGKIGLEDLAILSQSWGQARPQSLITRWTFDRTLDASVGVGLGRSIGDPAFAAGVESRVGDGALHLDGNDAVIARIAKPISGSVPRTTLAWIRTTSTIGPIVYWGRKDAPGGKWEMGVNSAGQLYLSIGGAEVHGRTRVDTGLWVHVAAALPAGADTPADIRLYVNGLPEPAVVAGETARIDTTPDTEVRFGMDNTGRFFTGLLDDIRVYDRDLAAEEIIPILETRPEN